MSIPLNINGAVFEYPENFDEDWGVNATGWAQAVTNGMLQRQGGNFPLTADANFGPSFGLISEYFTSHTTLSATAGAVRLAKTDTIDWRNNANSADNILSVNSFDQLTYNGVVIGAGTGVTSITGTANEIIASASTGNITLSLPQPIALSSSPTFLGLTLTGLTANTALITNGSDAISSSATTATELGYVSGVTSAIQTQLNGKLSLTGGTMSGGIAMGANNITGLANGTASADAVAFNQLKVFQSAWSESVTSFTTTSGSYVQTNLSISVTLSSASHRVMVWATGTVDQPATFTTSVTLMSSATGNMLPAAGGWVAGIPGGGRITVPASLMGIDTPGTAGPITYSVNIKTTGGTAAFGTSAGEAQVIMVQEII